MKSLSLIMAVAAAAALAAVGIVRGTYAAGGSDSSCYALMADAFARGKLQPSSALAPQVPWPDASRTFAPGGFLPSLTNPAAAVPVCAPGFSLLLAPALKLGGPNALFAVTPIAGALLVWLTFLAARALSGPLAGAMAAVLVATSPIVLFQVVQPMNDITTAMLWMAVFVALARPERATRVEGGRWGLAGVSCGLALLVRPNLLPLAVVAGLYVFWAGLRGRPGPSTASKKGPYPFYLKKGYGPFFLGLLPFVLAVLWLNNALYGGPFRSGYGQPGNLFSLANIPANGARYTRWLLETQKGFPFLAVFAPFLVDRDRRPAALLACGLIAATAVVYLTYTPFDDWSYLRFLMPAMTLSIVLASACVAAVAAKARNPVGPVMVLALTVALAMIGARAANGHFAFRMQALEQRYRSAGLVSRDRLPANAAVLTTWDSGAIRFHAQKEAIVWDALNPAWLDRAIDWLALHGHQPFILVESWEESPFRSRFGATSSVGNLDWPPKYEVDRVVRIYDPSDRARYMRGERVVTEYVWPLRK